MNKRSRLIAVFSFLSLGLAGCVGFKLDSAWRQDGIVIDGNDTEWQGSLVKEQNVSFGVANDADYLYLCLSVTDKKTKAQLMGLFRQSFSVWFDPEERPKRTFGIRFSNGSPLMKESLVNKLRSLATPSFELIAQEMMSSLEIEVMENDHPVALLADAGGIDVAVGQSMRGRKLTYELKVPLRKTGDHPYAVGSVAGKSVRVGLETSKIDMDSLLAQMQKEIDGSAEKQERKPGRVMRRPGEETGEPGLGMELEPVRYVKMWGKIKTAEQPRQQEN